MKNLLEVISCWFSERWYTLGSFMLDHVFKEVTKDRMFVARLEGWEEHEKDCSRCFGKMESKGTNGLLTSNPEDKK